MNSKEALETLGNVGVAVTTIRSGVTHFKTLKEQYEKEFEVLEKELLFVKNIKSFDVYEEQYKKLEKENQELKEETKKTIDEFLEHAQKNFRKYAKCKRALDILKDSFEIVAVKEDWDSEYIIETNSYFVCINKEEYEILKEVLGND